MASSQGLFSTDGSIPNFAWVLEQSLNPHQDRTLRVPFYLSSTYRDSLGSKGVSMKVNPSTVSFSTTKRITSQETQAGKVFFHWTNATGRNNDILEIEFRGQTGNINLKTSAQKGVAGAAPWIERAAEGINWLADEAAGLATGDSPVSVQAQGKHIDTAGAAKLVNFWNLYNLTREPVLDPRTGMPIVYYIAYNSTLFGNTYVTFMGHFSSVLKFEDSAEAPFSKTYSFSFTALSSVPSMDYLYTTIVSNIGNQFINLGGWENPQ